MTNGRTAVAPPYLVEIVGAAGAGKSTLTRSIHRMEPDWSIADFIHTRTLGHLRYVVHGVPRVFPILARGLGGRPRLTWREFKLLIYVTEWQRFLQRQPGRQHAVTLLDQGPIYALVRLKAEPGGLTAGVSFERWWNQMLELWSGRLGTIVYLDGPDRVLWSRINDRAQPHQTKGEAASVGQRFITHYRRLFDEVLDRIDALGGPEILRFDTGETPTEQIAEEIRRALATRTRVSGSRRSEWGSD